MSLLLVAESALGFNFGVRAPKELEIWCAKGMYTLKVVSSGKKGSYVIGLINWLIKFCAGIIGLSCI